MEKEVSRLANNTLTMDDITASLDLLPPGKYELIVPPSLRKNALIIAGEINYPYDDLGRAAVIYANKSFQLSVRVEEEAPPDTWYLVPRGR